MISLIITGAADQRENYINNFCSEHTINKFDIITVSPQNLKKTQSLGIENIREVHEKIYQKPLGDEKVMVFSGIELTIEAQNSLLKILEEPPVSTTIIISVDTINNVLPTIISRCKVVKLNKPKTQLTYPNIQKIREAKIGNKLRYAQELGKTKEAALDFLLCSIESLREMIHASISNNQIVDTSNYQKLLEKLNETYITIFSTNISPRFALEILFLSL